jgi:hypothetical protein
VRVILLWHNGIHDLTGTAGSVNIFDDLTAEQDRIEAILRGYRLLPVVFFSGGRLASRPSACRSTAASAAY